jgi:heme-degrading monooxygenase HmoA
MIVEQALLHIRAGDSAAFEAAFAQAKPLIAASPGFGGISVRPALDAPDTYLLLVEWESVAHHRDGFRQSERYARWRDLLHRFYAPMPVITYFGESL